MPNDPLLKKYIDCIYIIYKEAKPLKYFAYPSPHVAVALFRNATVIHSEKKEDIYISTTENYMSCASNRVFDVVEINYKQVVDEIAINFKPLGFNLFCNSIMEGQNFFTFSGWDHLLEKLFSNVFSCNSIEEKTIVIEAFLLRQYRPISDEKILAHTVALLSDNTENYSLEEVATIVGVHYKQLYRSFKKNIGCSLIHFRQVMRFRNSIFAALQNGGETTLTNICYDNSYTDQSYFIKQIRQLSDERPKRLLKDLALLGNGKIAWKFF